MKKILIAVLMMASVNLFGSEVLQSVTDRLQDISVTVVNNRGGQGSGVVTVRNGVAYVITAAHVVADERVTRTVIDSATHTSKTMVSFPDVRVVKEIVENGRKVETITAYAEVIRYSDADVGDDIAILRLRKHNLTQNSASFYLEKAIPLIGTPLIHVGSMMGIFGSNSMTTGILSQQGRVLDGQLYDQTSCIATNGSSGCGVYTMDGTYIGMLVRGAGQGFNFIVPIRRMLEWAKRNNAEWIFNGQVLANDDPTYPVENFLEAPSIDESKSKHATDEKDGYHLLVK